MNNLEKQIVSLLGLELGHGLLYITLNSKKSIAETKDYGRYFVDIDTYGRAIGIEILNYEQLELDGVDISKTITFLQVVRAKYEVEKKEWEEELEVTFNKRIFRSEYEDFIIQLWEDWQGESLAGQSDKLKEWIEGELK